MQKCDLFGCFYREMHVELIRLIGEHCVLVAKKRLIEHVFCVTIHCNEDEDDVDDVRKTRDS